MSHHIDGNDPPYLPRGCDQQGRYPQAAEASTELGADEPDNDSTKAIVGDVAICGAILIIIYAILAMVLYG